MFSLRFLGGAEVERNSVHDDGVLFEDLLEHLKGTTAITQKIFGNYLEPFDGGLLL